MLKKVFQENKSMKFLNVLLIASMLVLGGCKSSLLSGETPAAPVQPQTPQAPIVVDGVRTSYADIVEKTSPAVVRIGSERKAKASPQNPLGDMFRDFFPGMPQQRQQRPQIERGVGSGVIVSANGSILTNFHVVEGAEKITVQLIDNKTYEAKVVGTDQPSDLAVLKIEGENFPFLNLGNSDNVRVGDIVLAIGNPLGIGQTVTAGIISAKGRRTGLSDGSSFQDFLQTDAPINRGNSGGALVNITGELIGINSQIISDSGGGGNIGIGFSIPSNMAKTVMEQLIKDGKVHRGMLGVGIQPVTEDIAKSLELKESKGVLINSVRPGSAAEKAGIKVGDIITAINGEPTDDDNILRNKVAGTAPGTEIKVTLLRDGNSQEVTATLDEFNIESAKKDQPKNENEENPDKSNDGGKLGLSLQPVTAQIARELELPADTKGLVVMDVDPDGSAADAGVTRGDVIVEINRQPVKTLDEVQTAIEKSGNKPIFLLINRQGNTRYLTVTPRQ
jgi:Do/DeqQ family serine protease